VQPDLAVAPAELRELAGHAVHCAVPAASAYVLAGHVVQAVAAAALNEPTGQMASVSLSGQQ